MPNDPIVQGLKILVMSLKEEINDLTIQINTRNKEYDEKI